MPTEDETLSQDDVAVIMRALADPRRYCIMTQLAASEEPVSCAALFQAGHVSPSTLSHHLRQLEEAGLISIERAGRCAILTFERPRYERYLRQLHRDVVAPTQKPDVVAPTQNLTSSRLLRKPDVIAPA